LYVKLVWFVLTCQKVQALLLLLARLPLGCCWHSPDWLLLLLLLLLFAAAAAALLLMLCCCVLQWSCHDHGSYDGV
jgi:hypothetical protein